MDLKSSPVYFYAQKSGNFSKPNSVVTFELDRLNVGGAMNINTGVFTAPRSGTYHFSFTFMTNDPNKAIVIFIRKNGVSIGAAHTFALANVVLQSSLPATLKLKTGDIVDLFQIRDGIIYDDASHYTHFTGWLIEEDIDERLISLPFPTISNVKMTEEPCEIKGFPKNCHDIRCRGHSATGFYMVQSVIVDKKIETIYCDFSNPTPARTDYAGS